jgi:hypothetical protein
VGSFGTAAERLITVALDLSKTNVVLGSSLQALAEEGGRVGNDSMARSRAFGCPVAENLVAGVQLSRSGDDFGT